MRVLVDIEWVVKNVTESEIHAESSRIVVLYHPERFRYKASPASPPVSLALHCNVRLSLFLISLGQ